MDNRAGPIITEPKTCTLCLTFYANPKFGEYCSKCFKEEQSKKPEVTTPNKTNNEIKEENATIEEIAKETLKEKSPKLLQVTIKFILAREH